LIHEDRLRTGLQAVPSCAAAGESYSKHTTTTWSDDGALAVQSIPKLGTASGPSKITTTFSKRQGTFKCKWSWYGKTGNGPLKCTFA